MHTATAPEAENKLSNSLKRPTQVGYRLLNIEQAQFENITVRYCDHLQLFLFTTELVSASKSEINLLWVNFSKHSISHLDNSVCKKFGTDHSVFRFNNTFLSRSNVSQRNDPIPTSDYSIVKHRNLVIRRSIILGMADNLSSK